MEPVRVICRWMMIVKLFWVLAVTGKANSTQYPNRPKVSSTDDNALGISACTDLPNHCLQFIILGVFLSFQDFSSPSTNNNNSTYLATENALFSFHFPFFFFLDHFAVDYENMERDFERCLVISHLIKISKLSGLPEVHIYTYINNQRNKNEQTKRYVKTGLFQYGKPIISSSITTEHRGNFVSPLHFIISFIAPSPRLVQAWHD